MEYFHLFGIIPIKYVQKNKAAMDLAEVQTNSIKKEVPQYDTYHKNWKGIDLLLDFILIEKSK